MTQAIPKIVTFQEFIEWKPDGAGLFHSLKQVKLPVLRGSTIMGAKKFPSFTGGLRGVLRINARGLIYFIRSNS